MVYFLKSRGLLYVILGLVMFACNAKPEQEQETVDNEAYIMYQPSEMAVLMQEFYSYNVQLREEILAEEPLSEMPEEFRAIHSAKMTDSTGRTAIFKAYAPAYLQTQQMVLDSAMSMDVKTRYNNAINVCLACHKTECVGPIPRIKKLLIQ